MSAGLSRRALLRAFAPARPTTAHAVSGDDVPPVQAAQEAVLRVASIGSACVEPKGVTCRRCGEACDENAIRFTPLAGGRAMAMLNPVQCSGCGECLASCPVNAISLVARAAPPLVPAQAPEAHL